MKRILVPAEDPLAIGIRQKRAWRKALMEVKNTFSVSSISVSNQGVALYPFLESNVMRHWHQREVCENVMALVHESSS